MIIEDSGVVRQFLEHLISQDPRLEVAGSAGSAEEALRILDRASPDVISMDIRLPGMNGFEATRRIMADRPTPIVVVSASVESEDLQITMNALKAGALSVVEKPVGCTHEDYESLAERLCTQLAIMSQVKVVRQRMPRHPRPAEAPERTAAACPAMPAGGPGPEWMPGVYRWLGIAASTGGPNALLEILNGLGPRFPLPILLVQHMSAPFLEGFASWLSSMCPFQAAIARDGECPAGGRIHLAPEDRHLRLDAGLLRLGRSEPVCAQRPSATVLFQSMARFDASRSLGVVLTGMGEDGAEGLLELRRAGGYTITEDESTAVVYGMPAAAARLGAACESLPLPEIAPRILQLLNLCESHAPPPRGPT